MCHRLAQRVVRHQRAAAVEARQRTKRHQRVLAVAAGCLGACGPAEQAGARQRDLPAGGAAANHCRDSCPRDVDGGPTSNCAGRGCASIWSGCWRRAQGRCHKPDACSLGRGGCAPGPLPHLQVVAARHICCRRSKLHLNVSVESVAVGNVGACGGRGLACRARRQGTWQHGCAGTTDGEWAQQPGQAGLAHPAPPQQTLQTPGSMPQCSSPSGPGRWGKHARGGSISSPFAASGNDGLDSSRLSARSRPWLSATHQRQLERSHIVGSVRDGGGGDGGGEVAGVGGVAGVACDACFQHFDHGGGRADHLHIWQHICAHEAVAVFDQIGPHSVRGAVEQNSHRRPAADQRGRGGRGHGRCVPGTGSRGEWRCRCGPGARRCRTA